MVSPNKISANNFRSQFLAVSEVMRKFSKDKLWTAKSVSLSHWSNIRKSRYVETLILGMPQLPVYADGSEKQWVLIDGQERLKALFDFINGVYPLTSLLYKSNLYEGLYYEKLPVTVQQTLRNIQIQFYILNPGTPLLLRYGVYMYLQKRDDIKTRMRCRKHIFTNGYKQLTSQIDKIQKIEDLTNFRLLEIYGYILCIKYIYPSTKENIARLNTEIAFNVLLQTETIDVVSKDFFEECNLYEILHDIYRYKKNKAAFLNAKDIVIAAFVCTYLFTDEQNRSRLKFVDYIEEWKALNRRDGTPISIEQVYNRTLELKK